MKRSENQRSKRRAPQVYGARCWYDQENGDRCEWNMEGCFRGGHLQALRAMMSALRNQVYFYLKDHPEVATKKRDPS